MKFLKKCGVGSYLTCLAFLLTIVSWILYGVNVNSAGYFQGQSVPFVVLFNIFALLCFLLALVLAFLPTKTPLLNKVFFILQSVLLIGGAIFLMANAINFIGARAQGLGFIFGADDNAKAGFTADDYQSAMSSIVTFLFYLVTWLIALIAPFFSLTRKEKPVEVKA